jgi:hypothetical protein
MAEPTISFTVDDSRAQAMFQMLPNTIRDELSTAINNIVKKIKETINTDYRRSGSMYPSYLNPSPSGYGFTDRTGSLRQSIEAWVEENSHQTIGYVSAGMDYDKYVELLWGGKYSYMLPSLIQNQDYILNEVSEAVLRAISKFI